jgi:hypothetical protein
VAQALLRATPRRTRGARPRWPEPRFPPEMVVAVKAIACELPGAPPLAVVVGRRDQALAPPELDFPRAPDFAAKAGRGLDLYARKFEWGRLRRPANTRSALTRRLRSKPASAAIPPPPPDRVGPCAWSPRTTAVVLGRISPLGTFTAPSSLDA